MTTNTDSTIERPNAEFIRRSTNYPEYVLVRFGGSDRLAIVLAIPPALEDEPCILVDGHVALPEDDPRFPGEVAEIFTVRDDGVDLDGDLEYHADELAEESRVLAAEAGVEFSL